MSFNFATVWEALAASIPDADAVISGDLVRSWGEFEERAAGGAGGGRAGGEGDAAVTTTFNADLRGQRGEGRGKESLRDRLTERPSRGTGRGNRGGGRNAAPGLRERATNALKGRLPSGGGTSVSGKGGRGG